MLKLPKTVEGRRKVVAVDFWFVCSGFAVSVAVCSLVHGTLNNSGYANCNPCNQGIYCNIGKYKYSHIPAHHQWAAWVISMYVLPPLYRSQCHHPKNDFDQHAWEFAWKQWFEEIKNKSSWFSIISKKTPNILTSQLSNVSELEIINYASPMLHLDTATSSSLVNHIMLSLTSKVCAPK